MLSNNDLAASIPVTDAVDANILTAEKLRQINQQIADAKLQQQNRAGNVNDQNLIDPSEEFACEWCQ